MAVEICFGCRAITGAPRNISDYMGYVLFPPIGFKSELFTCERCGIEDVRLVVEPLDSDKDNY